MNIPDLQTFDKLPTEKKFHAVMAVCGGQIQEIENLKAQINIINQNIDKLTRLIAVKGEQNDN